MTTGGHAATLTLGLWLVLVAGGLVSRPLLPIDETRYVSVAWEMWQSGQWLVPHLNGTPYADKPPLLFWLMHAGWAVFGVSELWARLVPALFSLACLGLTRRLARVLWPAIEDAAQMAPLVVVGSILWTLLSDVVLFEMILACFVLLGICGTLDAWHRGGLRGWLLLGAALSLGLLAKGPVVLLYVLPVGLLAPCWAPRSHRVRWSAWYGGLALATALGVLVALGWAVPAALQGGPEYARSVLFSQTAARVVGSFAHQRPVWWYLPLLPLMFFPWLALPVVWRAFAAFRRSTHDQGVRFCIAWIVTAVVGFSLISGKQMHYLLPVFPAFALLMARASSRSLAQAWPRDVVVPSSVLAVTGLVLLVLPRFGPAGTLPEWAAHVSPLTGIVVLVIAAALCVFRVATPRVAVAALAAATVLWVVTIQFGIMHAAAPWFNTNPVGTHLSALEQRGHRIAHVGTYHGQYHFAGRLQRPFDIVEPNDVAAWLTRNPAGVIISRESDATVSRVQTDRYVHPYRSGFVVVRVSTCEPPCS